MDFKDLTTEQQAKAKAAKTREELEAIAAENGCELSDKEIEGIAGGKLCPRDNSCSVQTIESHPIA